MPAGRPVNPVRKIVKEIQHIQTFLKDSLEHTDPCTMQGIQARQREFTDKIGGLRADYKALLKTRAFAIFLVGSPDLQKKFADIANLYDCYVVDANVMYDSIVKKILPVVQFKDTFSSDHVLMVDDALLDVRSRLHITSMPHPTMTAEMCRPINNLENLTLLVKTSIEKVMDTELAAMFLEDLVTETACANEYTGSVFPVIVTNADHAQLKDFRTRLFKTPEGNKTFVISVDAYVSTADVVLKEVTDDTVIDALGQAATRFGFKIFKKAPAAEIDKPTEETVE
jgi:hypothetical protein